MTLNAARDMMRKSARDMAKTEAYSVHALISKLRRRLEGEAADDPIGETTENGILLTRPHGYVLTVADGELDLAITTPI